MPLNEHVVARSGGAVDAPFGRDHGLLVVHPDQAVLLGLAHDVADAVAFGHIEVEISLYAAIVGVS